jgi:hypothetical protein
VPGSGDIKKFLISLSKAIDDSILEASESDLREEFAAEGDDFDEAVQRVARAIERAKARRRADILREFDEM